MQYQVTHRTQYHYPAGIVISHHLARLKPRSHDTQQLHRFQLEVQPKPVWTRERPDYFGNDTTYISLEGPHRELIITASSHVQVKTREQPAPDSTSPWQSVVTHLRDSASPDFGLAREFLCDSPLAPLHARYAEYARESFPMDCPVLQGILMLTGRIHQDFTFDPSATTVTTPVEKVFHTRRGVCQDFAHLLLSCLRSLRLPARYVSGYLETTPPPGKPRLVGADASHAWVSAFLPDTGWIDVDPTNNLLVNDRHVTLAWGRDYSDVSPVRGVVVGSGNHSLDVAVDVVRVGAPL